MRGLVQLQNMNLCHHLPIGGEGKINTRKCGRTYGYRSLNIDTLFNQISSHNILKLNMSRSMGYYSVFISKVKME